jgi:valyl-tRNA synthetase
MRQTLGVVLRDVLKLFHPAIPFVTEELWSNLASGPDLLITAPWPRIPPIAAPELMSPLQQIVGDARRFRTQHQIPRTTEIPVVLVTDDPLPTWWLDQLASLGDCQPRLGERPDPIAGHTRMSATGIEGFIPLDGLIDIDAERPRLEKAIAATVASIDRGRAKLDNPNFTDRAPAEVVAQEAERLAELESELHKQQQQLEELG